MPCRSCTHPRRSFVLALALVCLCAIVYGAGAVNLGTGTYQVGSVGEAVSIPIVLDSVPGGLSGYRVSVSLTNPSVATIASVAFPEWASLKSVSQLPASQVTLQSVDLSQTVPLGGTRITLATLTVRGTATGTTGITIVADPTIGVQGRNGDMYPVAVTPGTLTVGGGPAGPVQTALPTTARPTPVPTISVPSPVPTATVPMVAPTAGETTTVATSTVVPPTPGTPPGGVTPSVPTSIPTGDPTRAPTLLVPATVPPGAPPTQGPDPGDSTAPPYSYPTSSPIRIVTAIPVMTSIPAIVAPVSPEGTPVPTVVAPGAVRPTFSFGKRYAIGDPGSYIGTRFGSGGTTIEPGTRAVTTAGPTLKPGSRAYGLTPPEGRFIRWYPEARWKAGIR